jgi:hypothetical protein
MDRIVRTMARGDQEFGIQDPRFPSLDVFYGERVHMMDQKADIDVVTRDSKVTAMISDDYLVPGPQPLGRPVEHLVHPPIEAEGSLSYRSMEIQVVETVLER